jgi:hypothetical protein
MNEMLQDYVVCNARTKGIYNILTKCTLFLSTIGPAVLKTINWTSELDEVFIDNFMNRDNTLKWQYFGSRDAVFRTYPGILDFYTSYIRDWYIKYEA